MEEIHYELDLTRYSTDQLKELVRDRVITEPEFNRELVNRESLH